MTKQSLPELSPASFLVWRFGPAAIALLVARARKLVTLTRAELHRGLLLGVFLSSGFSSRPLVCWTPMRGVGLSHRGRCRPNAAGGRALVQGARRGCRLSRSRSLDRWHGAADAAQRHRDPRGCAHSRRGRLLRVTHLGAVTATTWWSVTYLALAATCCGFVVQAWAQSMLTATTAAIVMTTEPLFAAVLAVTSGQGTLGIAGWAGGVLVVASMFIAEFGRGAVATLCPHGSSAADSRPARVTSRS